MDNWELQFFWAAGTRRTPSRRPLVDASILSDENACGGWGFTGAFIGLCALVLVGGRQPADFDNFKITTTH